MNRKPARQIAMGAACALLLLGADCAASRADVVEQTQSGFALQGKTHIAATPDKVYAALIQPQKWWNARHTFSQNAANLSLDAKAGGCLCEAMPDGGSVLHATVVFADPGRTLRLRGAMGPFQGQGVDSALTFTLVAKDDGTDIQFENNIGGFVKGGFGKLPQAADGMVTDLVAHLKHFVETGTAMKPDK